jgi:hypothetical protein
MMGKYYPPLSSPLSSLLSPLSSLLSPLSSLFSPLSSFLSPLSSLLSPLSSLLSSPLLNFNSISLFNYCTGLEESMMHIWHALIPWVKL